MMNNLELQKHANDVRKGIVTARSEERRVGKEC